MTREEIQAAGDHAFPSGDGEYGGGPNHCYGMTLRDWFAAQALNGILSGPASRDGVPMKEWFDAPEVAYKLADAMLRARSISSTNGNTP